MINRFKRHSFHQICPVLLTPDPLWLSEKKDSNGTSNPETRTTDWVSKTAASQVVNDCSRMIATNKPEDWAPTMSNGRSLAFLACIALDITIQFLSVSTHSIMSRGAIQMEESIGVSTS